MPTFESWRRPGSPHVFLYERGRKTGWEEYLRGNISPHGPSAPCRLDRDDTSSTILPYRRTMFGFPQSSNQSMIRRRQTNVRATRSSPSAWSEARLLDAGASPEVCMQQSAIYVQARSLPCRLRGLDSPTPSKPLQIDASTQS